MSGRVDEVGRRYDLALYGAWQGERLAREEKLRPLKHYQRAARRQPKSNRPQRPDEMLGVFRALEQSGVPIQIRRIG